MQFVAITKSDHARRGWQKYSDYLFAREWTTVPLVGAEIARALTCMPLCFVPRGDRYELSALLSVSPGANFYVDVSGRWLAGYVPAALRGYPFALLAPSQGAEPVLCIREDAQVGAADESGMTAFFGEDGEPSEQLRGILDFLAKVQRNARATQTAVDALAAEDCLEPWPLKTRVGDEDVPVEGLFRVNEAALNALDDAAFLRLRAAGALPVAYGQMLSMQQLATLQRLGQHQAQQQGARREIADLDELFGQDDDDMLRF